MRKILPVAFLLLTWLTMLRPAWPDNSSINDEQRRLLDVRRQQLELRAAQAEHSRMEQLSTEGLVSRVDVERTRGHLERTQLAYQEALLALINRQPRITIARSVKHDSPDGRKLLRLTLLNQSRALDESQFELLSNFKGADPLPDALRTRDVTDLYVSIKDLGTTSAAGTSPAAGSTAGTTIALPYEHHIPRLRFAESSTLTFQLLRDVDSVRVTLSSRGEERHLDVRLQEHESNAGIRLASTQVSQEADLGTQATYDLRLTRSSVDQRTFQLQVLNLPRAVGHSFLEPSGTARLSQISFPVGVTEQQLQLKLFLPEHADDVIRTDEVLEFWAVALDGKEAPTLAEGRSYSAEEIEKARAGATRLRVIPRGVGKIEVSAPSLYAEAADGATLERTITVRNTGTRPLDNIAVRADGPLNWRVELVPAVVPQLPVAGEATVTLKVTVPPGSPEGDYEVRLRSECYAFNQRVPSEEKTYRVGVKARTSLAGPLLLGTLFLGAIGGLVVAGIKLTRR
jgi:hypothetical protein